MFAAVVSPILECSNPTPEDESTVQALLQRMVSQALGPWIEGINKSHHSPAVHCCTFVQVLEGQIFFAPQPCPWTDFYWQHDVYTIRHRQFLDILRELLATSRLPNVEFTLCMHDAPLVGTPHFGCVSCGMGKGISVPFFDKHEGTSYTLPKTIATLLTQARCVVCQLQTFVHVGIKELHCTIVDER